MGRKTGMDSRFDNGATVARLILEALRGRLGEAAFARLEEAERMEAERPGSGLEWLRQSQNGNSQDPKLG
jgi:hypothetical protein